MILRALQRDIIFPRHYTVPDPGVIDRVSGLTSWWLEIEDGARVEAFFLPALNSHATPAPAVIFAHGNAELIDDWAEALEPWRRLGFHVLLPEYRGYGRSGGEPGQDAIAADLARFHDRLATTPGIDPERIVLHGRSLGGGALCTLAAQRRPAALILQSTFTSVTALARAMGIPGFVVSDPFDNLAVVRRYDGPTLVMHGLHDELIPVSHAHALLAAAAHGRLITWPCGHNDGPPDPEAWWDDLRTFVTDCGLL